MEYQGKAVGLLAIVAELQETHPEWTAWEVAEVAHEIAGEQQEKAYRELTKEQRKAANKVMDDFYAMIWKKKSQRRAEKMAAGLMGFFTD